MVDALALHEQKRKPVAPSTPSPHTEPPSLSAPAFVAVAEAPNVQPETKTATPPSAPLPPQELGPAPAPQQPPSLPPRPQPPPPTIDRHPEHLQFRDWELAFMKELHEFIPTPRAAKRFMNIYRLLRASVEEDERAAFVGGEKSGKYQAAMVLLAILTGYPTEATEILGALVEREPRINWWEFLASLKADLLPGPPSQVRPKSAAPLKKSKSIPAATNSPSAVENTSDTSAAENHLWLELFGKLDRLKESMKDRSCQAFVDWAPRVARYSFQSGRVFFSKGE
jgi:hypothetical protein